jgi:hypothetical protein
MCMTNDAIDATNGREKPPQVLHALTRAALAAELHGGGVFVLTAEHFMTPR